MTAPRLDSVQCLGARGLHRMAYAEWGDPANPRVLVCVHGLARQGRDFDVFAQAMSKHYRVVCPDVVGRGRSDWLADPAGFSNDPLCQSPKYYSLFSRGRRALQRAQARRRGVKQTVAISDLHSPHAGVVPKPLGRWHFAWGSSGPFGEDTYGEWKSLEEISYDFLHLKMGHQRRCAFNPRGWHDFHATRRAS